MAIGHGQGVNKADKAIDQALNHPMLESVSLEHAAGIIANFTGGPDLTLFEVEAALTRLQEQTTSNTEIVLGIINDDRMEERVQVTLIVTGLGAPTLEETLSKVATPQPMAARAEQAPVSKPIETIEPDPLVAIPVTPLRAAPDHNDIDLPAFLRRRIRYAG